MAATEGSYYADRYREAGYVYAFWCVWHGSRRVSGVYYTHWFASREARRRNRIWQARRYEEAA